MRKINFISSLVFEILKVLIDSFDITGHAWPRPPKITLPICSFKRHVTAFKKSTLYLQ